jgi:hypothetical protein
MIESKEDSKQVNNGVIWFFIILSLLAFVFSLGNDDTLNVNVPSATVSGNNNTLMDSPKCSEVSCVTFTDSFGLQ